MSLPYTPAAFLAKIVRMLEKASSPASTKTFPSALVHSTLRQTGFAATLTSGMTSPIDIDDYRQYSSQTRYQKRHVRGSGLYRMGCPAQDADPLKRRTDPAHTLSQRWLQV